MNNKLKINNDLISRKTAVEKLTEYADSKLQLGRTELANGVLRAIHILENQDDVPTAYSIEKVVEELENEKEFWSDANAYNKEMVRQKARSYAHAIEIVKGGKKDE